MSTIRELFDDWAREGRAEGMEAGHGPAARLAFQRLGLQRAGRYLDIGCGNGYTVRWAAAAAPDGHAMGVDISDEMIGRARRMSEGIPNVSFIAGAFPHVDAGAAPFDAVFSMEVLYYLPDLPAALRRIHDIMVPGGRFACVVDYYGENEASHGWPADLGVPMTLLDERGWSKAFEDAGLTVVEQSRLRLSPDAASSPWKVTHGSLMTLGARPGHGGSAEQGR